MTRRTGTVAAAGLVLAGLLALGAFAASAPAAGKASGKPTFTSVTLLIRHRVFGKFHDREVARPDKEFLIGDTDYTGKIVRYVPDFYMNVKTGEIRSRSNEPKNPAFQIIVKQAKVPQDTTWAFLRIPPHFARNSMLSFEILRIDFPDHPPVVNADSIAGTPPSPPPVVTPQPSHESTGASPH
jgi:hypothetical protein